MRSRMSAPECGIISLNILVEDDRDSYLQYLVDLLNGYMKYWDIYSVRATHVFGCKENKILMLQAEFLLRRPNAHQIAAPLNN